MQVHSCSTLTSPAAHPGPRGCHPKCGGTLHTSRVAYAGRPACPLVTPAAAQAIALGAHTPGTRAASARPPLAHAAPALTPPFPVPACFSGNSALRPPPQAGSTGGIFSFSGFRPFPSPTPPRPRGTRLVRALLGTPARLSPPSFQRGFPAHWSRGFSRWQRGGRGGVPPRTSSAGCLRRGRGRGLG